jgi:predicted ATPase
MITDHNREHVVRLCRRLDGIPLAIELAAARVRTLTPAELADRLDSRFRLLASGPRTAVERHQTLQRAIDWSYDLLSDSERTVLNRLAVFAGSFTLAAAEGVVADEVIDAVEVIDLLGHLVDKSLLTAEHHERVSRYRLLETIRQYAQERLEAVGEADAFRQRHAEYYASFSAAAGEGLRGADEVAWTARAEAELDNLRAAVGWAHAGGDADLAIRLVTPLALNGTRIGYATGGWAGPTMALPGAAEHPRYPEVQAWAGWAALISGESELGVRLAEEAVQAINADPGAAASACCVLRCVAGVLISVGRVDESAILARRWADLARSREDDFELAQALIMVGVPLAWRGNPTEALVNLDQAVAVARRLGNPTAITYATMAAGMVRVDGEPERALELLDEALDRATSVGNQLGLGQALQTSADLHLSQGDVEGAIRLVARAMEHYYEMGDKNYLRMQLFPAVAIFSAARADETAALLYGAAPLGGLIPLGWTEQEVADRTDTPQGVKRFWQAVADLRSRLGEDRFLALADRGGHMNDDEVVHLLRRTVSPLPAAAPGDDHPGRFVS